MIAQYDERISALASVLNVPEEDISSCESGSRPVFSLTNGREYFVLNDHERFEGMRSFLGSVFRKDGWIFEYPIYEYMICTPCMEEYMMNFNREIVAALKCNKDRKYGSELMRVAIERDIIEDKGDEETEEWLKKYDVSRIEESVYKSIFEGMPVNTCEAFVISHDTIKAAEMIQRGDAVLDWDKFTEVILRTQGGHVLAYDNDELYEDGYYIYRIA